MTLKIVFCTTCKGRAQHLKETLPQNLADNPRAKFVVVDYNSQDDLLEWLRTECGEAITYGRLVVYSYKDAPVFKMAHAKNMAHRLGIIEGADILVNLDADNLTGPGFDSYVEEQFSKKGVFLWARMKKGILPRGISGRIAVTTGAFLKVGGYDEKYEDWGPDDKDFNRRLRMIGYEGVEIDDQYLRGLPHNDKMRFKEYPHAISGLAHYHDAESVLVRCTIANNGNYGCGTVYRNFEWSDPYILEPLPTRIFGIGMHKTATTSLHHAFEMLGYESAHWPSAHWAKAVWREMNNLGHSPTLEKTYAACDLPITLLYEKLDKAYPGSKFILTIKDERQWLTTVERHWNPQFNKFRNNWDSDPFTNRIHKVLYGRTDFDAATFLARYRSHNEAVLKYFEGRNDLLVMKMDEGAGWNELCGFLKQPFPQDSYPNAYSSY